MLRGRAVLTRPISRENNDEAVKLFETALALDPKAVDAHAWLSVALTVRVTDELSIDPDADLQRAERLADQALAASPDSALAHYAKGQVLRAQSRCRKAIPEFERAIALDPSRVPGLCPCRLVQVSDRLCGRSDSLFRAGNPPQPLWTRHCPMVRPAGSHAAAAGAYRPGARLARKANGENARLAF